MASKHILSLEIPAVSNCDLLCIKDTSQYSNELAVDCEELLITLPGYSVPVLIKVDSKFDMCLTACTLALQKDDCGTKQQKLPDGVYIVKYSVSPNSKVYVEYNHLRVTNLMKQYYDKLCQLDLAPCVPTSERKRLLSDLNDIRMYIDAAVAKVEYAANPNAGLELFNFAKKLLSKITCPTC